MKYIRDLSNDQLKDLWRELEGQWTRLTREGDEAFRRNDFPAGDALHRQSEPIRERAGQLRQIWLERIRSTAP